MHAAKFLKLRLLLRTLATVIASTLLAACADNLHTLENTSDLSRGELIALCEDLEMRASQDCSWNMQQQQSRLENQQTWEVNCRARRDSARRSYENVCLDGRTDGPAYPDPAE
jgi:hypothetical protein